MNCKEEFLDAIVGHELLCAEIRCWVYPNKKTVLLPVGFTGADLKRFLEELDFEYDNGWCTQEVFGVIWYTDGTWSEREFDSDRQVDFYAKYNCFEYWVYKSCPKIPEDLMGCVGDKDTGKFIDGFYESS